MWAFWSLLSISFAKTGFPMEFYAKRLFLGSTFWKRCLHETQSFTVFSQSVNTVDPIHMERFKCHRCTSISSSWVGFHRAQSYLLLTCFSRWWKRLLRWSHMLFGFECNWGHDGSHYRLIWQSLHRRKDEVFFPICKWIPTDLSITWSLSISLYAHSGTADRQIWCFLCWMKQTQWQNLLTCLTVLLKKHSYWQSNAHDYGSISWHIELNPKPFPWVVQFTRAHNLSTED